MSFAIAFRTVARFSAIVERASAMSSRRAPSTSDLGEGDTTGGAGGVDGGDKRRVVEVGHDVTSAHPVAHLHGNRDDPLGLTESHHGRDGRGARAGVGGDREGRGDGEDRCRDDRHVVDHASGELCAVTG